MESAPSGESYEFGRRLDAPSRSRLVGNLRRRGSALLTVLWISAALAAVAFSLANTVRGETDRTSTELDEIRSYYLAVGAVDRASIEVLWTAAFGKPLIPKGAAWVDYTFPTGVAHVELIPETAKLDVNSLPPEQLGRLMTALGINPGAAMQIVAGIMAHRPGGGGAGISLPSIPSFPGAGTSFQEIEELLQVRGVTPEIFYGTYVPAESGSDQPDQPALIRRSGLVDCLSVYGSKDQVDVNTADPAVLLAIGIPPAGVQSIVRERRTAWFTQARLDGLGPNLGPAAGRLRREGNSILTIRATARVRLANGQLSDMKRTVAGQVKYMPAGFDSPIHILRWYDTTWSN
uniref:General secretion pathway protein K n=1 Tax=Solibacter usitatus (strain Ellin6076) TaxID=234267 RepID=Q01NT8_SOLUE